MKKVYAYFLILLILFAGPFITHCSTPPQPTPQRPAEPPAVLPEGVSICELSPELEDVRVKFTGEIKPGSLDTADPNVIELLAVDPEESQCQVCGCGSPGVSIKAGQHPGKVILPKASC